jgi:hypothetical protein
VFPVLSLKVMGFAAHAQDRRVLLAGGLAYTAGVVLSFVALAALLLALRAGGEQLGWGFQLQSPGFVALLAALFTLIGLNLAGVFEFGNMLPSRWMAARALIDGAVTVSGDDYPEQYVDFDRHSTLSYLLTSTARWGEGAAAPLTDIRAARKNAFERGGYPVQDLIFGSDAWDRFTANADVKALLSTQTRGSTSDWRAPVMNDGSPFAFEGTIGNAAIGSGGQIRLWTYSNFYEETLGGNRVNYLDTNTVVGIGNPMGVRAFGAIMDADAGLAALPMFPKMWKNMDPSVNYTMTASAPLMVPMNPNSTFKIKVY